MNLSSCRDIIFIITFILTFLVYVMQLNEFLINHSTNCNKVGFTIEQILPLSFGVIFRVICACGAVSKDITDYESW